MGRRGTGGRRIEQYGPKVCGIMSRFRPIAPKPAVPDVLRALPCGVPAASAYQLARVFRTRRSCRRRGEAAAFRPGPELTLGPDAVPHVVAFARPVRFVGSWVTVESVSETCAGGAGVWGSAEGEARLETEWDRAPMLVSGPGGSVAWTNEAYRKMVGGGAGEEGVVVLWNVGKVDVEDEGRVLACRVKVEWRGGKVTVPADVWRVAGDSLAWRLDVDAALSLGR